MATYLYLPGTSGNYASAPDSVALSITGDLDVRVRVDLADWTPSAQQHLVTKWREIDNQRSYVLLFDQFQKMRLLWSTDGTSTTNQERVSAVVSQERAIWLRATLDVDNGASGHDVRFYTSEDGVAWTQLGTTSTTAGITSIFDGAAVLGIGASNTGSLGPTTGYVYRAEVYSGIGGTLVFDARFDQQAVGTTSFAEAANGATVTINQSGDPAAEIVSNPRFRSSARQLYMQRRR